MAYSFPEIKRFSGLYLQANSFSVPDGALEQADNCTIGRDDILTKRRGYYQYYDPGGSALNALFFYNNTLLGVEADKIGYFADTGSSPNETGTFTQNTGVTVDILSPRISRSSQANKNLYFTTDGGVLKLESPTGSVYKAGTPPALDLTAEFSPGGGFGPVGQDKLVGWRIVFGRTDSNSNLILGAPSDIVTLSNASMVLTSGTPWSRSGSTVTVTTVNPHSLVVGMQITITASTAASGTNINSNVFPVQFTVISVPSTTTFTFSDTTSAAGSGSALTFYNSSPVRLQFSVPSEITSVNDNYFYQIYRSSQVAATSESIFSDFKETDQLYLTSAQITAGVVFYDDEIDDLFLGAELYTNENSQEGELQANTKAPLCQDLALFKGYLFYGNCISRHYLDAQVVTTSGGSSGDYVETRVILGTSISYTATGSGPYTIMVILAAHGLTTGDTIYVTNGTSSNANGEYAVTVISASSFTYSASSNPGTAGTIDFGKTRRYVARTGVANKTVSSQSLSGSGTITVTYTAHGLVNGDTVYISNVKGGSYANQGASVSSAAANTFVVTLSGSGSPTQFDFQGVTNGTYPIFEFDQSSPTASQKIQNTAQGLVKAINRDAGSLVYASYSSGITDVPGKLRLSAKGFTSTIFMMASTTGLSGDFFPELPQSFGTGNQVFSSNDVLPSTIFISKFDEPEAVPLVNFVNIGASNKAILRIHALRDSLIIVKEDGVFRLTGTSVQNFDVTILDSTVFCAASNSSDVLNNQVVFLSNQGVCLVTEASVQVVSRVIEEVIQPILGISTLSSQTAGLAYESERLYMLSTVYPGQTTASSVWVYNFITSAWTRWDTIFSAGCIGPSDTAFLITNTNKIAKERKKQTLLDYSGQNYPVTVSSVSADGITAQIVMPTGIIPSVGDVLVKNDVFSRIQTVLSIGSNTYTVTFPRQTNLVASDSVILYSKYSAIVKSSPFHAGLIGRTKQFSQFQIHTRSNSCSKLTIYFTGELFGSSQSVIWTSQTSGTQGWGYFPWGFAPWGQADAINILQGSQSSSIVRIYIPLYQQRTTAIQPVIQHDEAGESMNFQAFAYAVRAYNERVSR